MAKLRHIAMQVPNLQESANYYEKLFELDRVCDVESKYGNAVMLSGCTIHKDASSFCARASVSLTQKHELSSQPECINSPLRDSMDGRQRNCRMGEDRRAFGRWAPRVRRNRRQSSARHARGRQCHQRGRHVREAILLLFSSQNRAHDHCRQPSLQRPSVRRSLWVCFCPRAPSV